MQLRLLLQLTHVLVGVSCLNHSLVRQLEDRFLEQFKDALRPIFPGTLWCGPGDRAKSLEDVGLFKGSDSCCREHDICPDNIPGWGSKHGLVNKGPFTKSHCDCDDRFFQCLKDVMRSTKSPIAPQIGIAYFNVVGPQCFKEEYPIVKCTEKHKLPICIAPQQVVETLHVL
ncbi:phospholipase A2 isoform X3 [Anabrus simplex]|uniref:phospholipase A2 isoform X3 n=1 Tax=Anabrus simplex TaxID=316456 RepID=UPI0035A3BF17